MTDLSNAKLMIKQWESCKLEAYPDPATGDKPWTIGYGSTGPLIKKDVKWTQQMADNDLDHQVNTLFNKISDLLDYDLDDCQLCALISFAYNLGIGNLKSSTLLRKINNDGFGDEKEFLKWCNANGRPMEGLKRRRIGEMLLFEGQGVKSNAYCAELVGTYYK